MYVKLHELKRFPFCGELTRCKYCIHWDDHTEECGNPDRTCFHNGWWKPDWYCADGERRQSGDERNHN